jgi:glycosyltransferase involved in cell wall biosynthesis
MKDSNAPKASIIVPAYRVSEYIGEALESVFSQTYRDFEVLVVDQDMDQKMDRALEPFKEGEEGVIRLPLHRPSLPAARNKAIRHARGTIMVNLDWDDVWEPTLLEVLIDMMDADPSLDAVFPNAVYFGGSREDGVLFQDLYPAFRPITYEDVITRRSQIFGGAAYRKVAAESVGGYDENLPYGEDFDLWIRTLRAGCRFDFTEKVLTRYRRRETAMHKSIPRNRQIECMLGIYEKQLADMRLTASQRMAVEAAKASLESSVLMAANASLAEPPAEG